MPFDEQSSNEPEKGVLFLWIGAKSEESNQEVAKRNAQLIIAEKVTMFRINSFQFLKLST